MTADLGMESGGTGGDRDGWGGRLHDRALASTQRYLERRQRGLEEGRKWDNAMAILGHCRRETLSRLWDGTKGTVNVTAGFIVEQEYKIQQEEDNKKQSAAQNPQ